ncbi:hypothetical protein ACLI4Y_13320 [Natrialbaceae archaeon A-CW3]
MGVLTSTDAPAGTPAPLIDAERTYLATHVGRSLSLSCPSNTNIR